MGSAPREGRRGSWLGRRATGARGQRAAEADQVIGAIAVGTGELGVHLVDVAGNVDAVSERVAEQAQLFVRLSADADSMRSDNREVAAAAASAREATHQATVRVLQSQELLHSSLGGVHDLASWVEGAGDQMQSLAKRAESVSGLARQVEAIARRTHILALNAGIEAAKSGSAGRGFSVIATSVRQLADQTIEAASNIDDTLGQLADQIRSLGEDGGRAQAVAGTVERDVRSIDEMIAAVGVAMSGVDQQAAGIADGTSRGGEKVNYLVDSLVELVAGVEHSSSELETARGGVNSLLGEVERLIGLTARTGVPTVDTPFVALARQYAATVEALCAEELAAGRITLDQLFTHDYDPVPGTDPEQFRCDLSEFADRVIQPLLDQGREADPGIKFVVVANLDGYVPCHHPEYAQQQGDDPVWNNAHCRNRRFFLGRTELTGARNTEPFLLQTYRRPMGGNTFMLMKDAAAPIVVNGRHWGGLRIGYVTG
jgi:methyl-accepting chemotaxis protein